MAEVFFEPQSANKVHITLSPLSVSEERELWSHEANLKQSRIQDGESGGVFS